MIDKMIEELEEIHNLVSDEYVALGVAIAIGIVQQGGVK